MHQAAFVFAAQVGYGGSRSGDGSSSKKGLISASDRDSIIEGLEEIERCIMNGEFNWRADREDVHMNIGEPAKKLHTARSRNNKVFTDFRLWCRDAIDEILVSMKQLQDIVRYYAYEALYNIAKVVRGDFIIFFNQIFDALCKLSADSDANVQSAAHLLDRLMKDIVTESDQFSVPDIDIVSQILTYWAFFLIFLM
ncbi:hypothetical protein V8G54_024828, partial [Vigna mungo]